MTVFGAYSQYYDLLYKDKDYAGEAAYVRSLVEQHRPGARSLLDLGCGTGRHALLLATKGYAVTGVDRSAEMRPQLALNWPPLHPSTPWNSPAPEQHRSPLKETCGACGWVASLTS